MFLICSMFLSKPFVVVILYTLKYQSWDACILIRFISHFWSKINKWRWVEEVAIRISWCVFSKKKKIGYGRGGASIPDSRLNNEYICKLRNVLNFLSCGICFPLFLLYQKALTISYLTIGDHCRSGYNPWWAHFLHISNDWWLLWYMTTS